MSQTTKIVVGVALVLVAGIAIGMWINSQEAVATVADTAKKALEGVKEADKEPRLIGFAQVPTNVF